MPAMTVCPALNSVTVISLPKPVLVPVIKIILDIRFVLARLDCVVVFKKSENHLNLLAF
jgi:hypothetical protein